jgi:hypothetical protein
MFTLHSVNWLERIKLCRAVGRQIALQVRVIVKPGEGLKEASGSYSMLPNKLQANEYCP